MGLSLMMMTMMIMVIIIMIIIINNSLTSNILHFLPRISRLTWEDNIRVNLKEKGVNTRDWIDSAQNWDYWR